VGVAIRIEEEIYMAERSREMINDATRVLLVWKAMAMMSHIRRA
jgi:hypothetical protein